MKTGVTVLKDKTASVLKSIRALTKDQVLVGVPSDESGRQESDGITNAVIGFINEFGSEAAGVPPAPHLIPGVEDASEKCAEIMAQGAYEGLSGNPSGLEKAMNRVGLVAQAAVRKRITDQKDFDDLAESTVEARRRKGFQGTKRLIYTGQYRNSINYVIRKK